MHLREVMCLFCLTALARLGLDKKGRPYLHCTGCGARSFLPIYECLNGLAILPPLVEAWKETVPDEDRRTQLAMYLADLKQRAQRTVPHPQPTPGTPEARKLAVDKVSEALKEVTK